MSWRLKDSAWTFSALAMVCLTAGCGSEETPAILLERARILLQRDQPAEAVPLLDTVIREMPTSPEARYQRGVAFERLDVPEKALNDYSECLKIDKERRDALNNKAVILARLLRFEEALAEFSRLIELDPQLSLAWRNRALCYSDQKKYTEALADYGKALELDPKDPVNWYQRGTVYLAQANLTAAEDDFSKALELDPELARGWMNRGITRFRRGNKTAAAEDLKKAQELDDTIVVPDVGFFSEPPVAAPDWPSIRESAVSELSARGYSEVKVRHESPVEHWAEFSATQGNRACRILCGLCSPDGTSAVLPALGNLPNDQDQVALLLLRQNSGPPASVNVMQFDPEWRAGKLAPVSVRYLLSQPAE